ncbi:hypothetical protein SASPL_142821 [Salvia splendens]|uniref:SLH domain-containing protein n=1 Tax=Salvia splendens TaxID=180675 RepID=A0A8X8WL01_SALSN|nr:uncharacterized protein LOC121769701 [Salvia splendens]KAG6396666.1 hypothetical protein SASPL_142821 [Salvia splendens]
MSSISLCLPSKTSFLLHNHFNFVFHGSPLLITRRNPRHISLSASVAEKNSSLEFSWVSWDKVSPDNYNGWDVLEPAPKIAEKKGWRTFAVVGFGASVAASLGFIAYFWFYSKGFGVRFRSPLSALHGFSVPSLTIKDEQGIGEVREDDVPSAESEMPEEALADPFVVTEHKRERVIVPCSVDVAQQEAVSSLKKLKIIEDSVGADELCTRREYARWLVRANSQLERSRKHRLNPFAALCGSRITAFDDVGVEDPDFEHIQTLAEAGIIRSKLSEGNHGPNLNGDKEFSYFSPERFISRQDLVTWKAKIEYDVVSEIDKEMARRSIGFLDVKEISSDVLLELFADYRADRKSITRGVFGQSRRFQPSKPCTKAQAAVALTCGRVTEFIRAEISRLEAEKLAKEIELKELMTEILERGDIKEYWEQKMEKERKRGLEVELEYRSAIMALEEERVAQENGSAELVKQKAALECQEQLLSSIKAEGTEMSEILSVEKAKYDDELRGIQETRHDLQAKYEELIDAKSILEAEIEALRILRSWVEDEAKKSQARAKVLEEAGRRWKWDG